MAAIDVHTHAFPDKLAGRAISTLESHCPWKAVGDGRIETLLASMDAADIDMSAVCCIATKSDQAKGILEWCKQIRSDRIIPFPSVHPDTPEAHKWIEKIAAAEFPGIKLHPMYQDFELDETRLEPIYQACAKTGLLVQFHCGQDIGFSADDDRAAPQRLRRVIDKFPDLRVICTHMGGWRAWDDVEQYLLGADVWMETSFSLEDMGQRAAEFIERHGADRIMLGSAWPWKSQAEDIEQVKLLNLDAKTTDNILCNTAAKLLLR